MMSTKLPFVMLIDDNDIDLFLNKKFLRVAGITDNTISFLSAQSAIEYIEAHAHEPETLPGIILLDIQMPGINGFQFLELFENIPDSVKRHTKIVMLSSTTDPFDLAKAKGSEQVINILRKPLDPQELKDVLSKCA